MSNRSVSLIIGAMRSGKSFLANRLAANYCARGGSAFFYNLGKPKDFDTAQNIVLKNVLEHVRDLPKEKRQDFKLEGELTKYSEAKTSKERDLRLFSYEWAAKAAKAARLEPASERMLFDTIYGYFANTLIVLDDCRAMFRHGLSSEAITLFSRINHTGVKSPFHGYRGAGCDIIAITHNPEETIIGELMVYATDVYLFRTEKRPDFNQIKNEYIRDNYRRNFDKLLSSPKYSFLYLNPDRDICQIVIP